MDKDFFSSEVGMPSNADEIEKTAKEALEAVKKYPDSVTEQQKPNDGSIEIPVKEPGTVKDLRETLAKVAKEAERKEAV